MAKEIFSLPVSYTHLNAIILQYMSPVYVLLISVIFFKQKARGKDILVDEYKRQASVTKRWTEIPSTS